MHNKLTLTHLQRESVRWITIVSHNSKFLCGDVGLGVGSGDGRIGWGWCRAWRHGHKSTYGRNRDWLGDGNVDRLGGGSKCWFGRSSRNPVGIVDTVVITGTIRPRASRYGDSPGISLKTDESHVALV